MPRLSLIAVFLLAATLAATADPGRHPVDPRVRDHELAHLPDYRTVDTAVTTRVSRAEPNGTGAPSQPGYLGITVEAEGPGRLKVAAVDPQSPAAAVGLQPGDVVTAVSGQKVEDSVALGDRLRASNPGDKLSLRVERGTSELDLTPTLTAVSRPLTVGAPRPSLGVQVVEAPEGALVERVVANASLFKVGDLIRRLDDLPITGPQRLDAILWDKKPGDNVTVVVQRAGKDVEVKVPVAAVGTDPRGQRMSWDDRVGSVFRKDVFRLAVILVEYPDQKHNPKISTWDWEQSLFSRGTYISKSPTGDPVYGSMNDYYQEQSCGAFRVEGKAFDWVMMSKKRTEYGQSTNMADKMVYFNEALDKLLKRDGKDALNGFDGLYFLYAGDRVQTNRGGLYWPHRSSLFHNGKRWAYFICPEGGARFSSISVIAHEFGHMLGLPDLYARPESPGSEGLGVWCTMSVGHGRDGKPLHFSAWCKEQLGWLKPTVIDPSVKQKLILAPIENSPRECYKVLVRPDGSEYLLLENRATKGFDRDLPAEGLLIWRVVDGRPVLEESHGVAGPRGPEVFLGSVPYPSGSNTAFTPYTTPSSRSLKGGGKPVFITNITRLPDGRITFQIGYEYF